MTFKKRSCRLNIRVGFFFKSSTPDPEHFHLIKYISVFLKQSLFYYESQIHDFTCLLNYRLLDKRKNIIFLLPGLFRLKIALWFLTYFRKELCLELCHVMNQLDNLFCQKSHLYFRSLSLSLFEVAVSLLRRNACFHKSLG